MSKQLKDRNAIHFKPICDNCAQIQELEAATCQSCGGNIHFTYDQSFPIIDSSQTGLNRYWSRLPLANPTARVSLGEGNTPLLAFDVGHKQVWVKNEMTNPTGSHKDRQLSLAISHAKFLGKTRSVLVSAGSTGLANAAYAARAGISSTVFTGLNVREDRVYPIHVLGSGVIRVNSEIDLVIDELTRVSHLTGTYNSSTARHINPYQAEGPKTIAYEIYEQLGFAPDWMVVPAGGGGTYAAIGRAFIELYEEGLTNKVPRLVGAVPTSYNALEHGFNRGYQTVSEIKQHNIGEGVPTILAKLAHIHPPDAEDALSMARKVNGFFLSATDEESIDGSEFLASKMGLYTEPSSGTNVAVLRKFLETGHVRGDETVVFLACGSGFRETTTLAEQRLFHPSEISFADIERYVLKNS